MSSREELLQLLEPPTHKWVLPSPDEVVRAYGTALPADYMWLIEVYGPGAIEGSLNILAPLPAAEIGTAPGVTPMSAEQFLQFDEVADIEPSYLETGGLITWGFDLNNDTVFWSPVGEPDAWPVVIRRHNPQSGPTWVRYDFGVVELLVHTFQGRLDDNPFSGDDLWRNGSPTFTRS
ncbi:MAG: hypothetical protein HOV87_15220 [Catenulispora sp.]|nr:hypothetical protein [Catenulispora sp.]